MTATYTRETLTTREMTKPKLQAIAAGLEIEFENNDTKAQLIDWILFAQEQAAQAAELDETPPELDEVEAIDPTSEETLIEESSETVEDTLPEQETLIEESSEPTYEERLVLYLDRRVNEFREDSEAVYLLARFAEFKASLTAKPAKVRTPRTGGSRTADPAEKLAIAQQCHEAMVRANGSAKAAGDSLGKSAHYTKVLAKAYELYQASEAIRTAYDNGSLRWTALYDLAFNFKKADTIEDAEQRMNAAIAA